MVLNIYLIVIDPFVPITLFYNCFVKKNIPRKKYPNYLTFIIVTGSNDFTNLCVFN